MFSKNILLLLPVFILDSEFNLDSHQENSTSKKILMNMSGSLIVNYSTTVNQFDCIVMNYYKTNTLVFEANHATTNRINLSGDILIPIQSFDCHNKMMTAELLKILKAKEYPFLKIHFISLVKYPF